MLSRRSLLAGGLAVLATPHVARAAGITVHLCGDSIAWGFALGRLPPQVSPSEPLYPFRSIAGMANLVLEENFAPAAFSYLGFSVIDGGASGTLARLTDQHVIRPGDWVVLEEAGAHNPDPAVYQDYLTMAVSAASAPGVNVAVLTMFDYPPAPAECQNDAGSPSMNDVARSAAAAGNATLIDCNESMDRWRTSAKAADGVNVIHPDGIHPNVWGQMRMTADILRAVGMRNFIFSARTAMEIAGANYQKLSYGANTRWNSRRAETYCAYLFLGNSYP
jgi:hypothetical protein